MKWIESLNKRIANFLTEKGFTQKQLATLCWIAFFVMLVPLVVIAVYNYPADDDFGFTLPAATAWVNTHSLGAVFSAIVQKTTETYYTWQGNFVSTFFFAVNPLVFNIQYYFLSAWVILGMLCLCVGYLLKSITDTYLHTTKAAFAIVYFAVMLLVLQFMPYIGDGIYWHNGGQYTVAVCMLMLTLGLLIRLAGEQSAARRVVRSVLAALLGLMLGGTFYGPALGAFVILLLITVASLYQKTANRWASLLTFALFCVTFAISVSAPGSAVRLGLNGEPTSVLYAVGKALTDSFDMAGKWLSLQLIAMLMLILPVLWKPLQESKHGFRHPFLVFVMLYGLFAAAPTPAIYTRAGYDFPRYMNALYLYFLIMAIGSAVYAEGALIRFLQRRQASPAAEHALLATQRMGERFCCLYLVICLATLAFGGFANTIMNTNSLSAAKSLITGQAAQFKQEMAERQEYIRVTDSDIVAVQPLSSQVYVFKYDRLPYQGIYGRVRYMKWYFELFENATHPAV